MTLRKKTLLITGVMIVGMIVILYAASQIILLRSFSKLEEQFACRNVDRALYILSDALSALNATCDDRASWDDTCAFIENAGERYIESDLGDETFVGLRLNLMLFVDSSGRIVFGKAFDLQNETEIPIPQSIQRHISAGDLLLRHPDTKSSTAGIVLLPEGPMLVASQPILTSKNEGPVRGTLIMGRCLTSTEIERLAGILHSSFTICRLDDSQMPPDFREALSSLSEKAPIFTRPLSAESVAGYALIKDIYGKPCLVLRVDMPRRIYRQGQAALRFFILAVLVVSLVYGVMLMLFLDNLVLSRLSRLNRRIRGLSRSGDLSGRIPVTGSDELSDLAGEINGLLETQEQSRHKLQESEEKYSAFFRTSKDCVFITSRDGSFIEDINDAGAELFGYEDKDDLMRVKVSELFENPEDRERNTRIIEHQGFVRDILSNLRKKDGGIISALVTAVARKDEDGNVTGYQGIIRDITESEQAKAEIIRLKEYSENILNSIPAYIMVLDKDLTLKFVNRTYLKTGKYRDEAMVGRNLKDLYPEDLLEEGGLREAVNKALETGETSKLYDVGNASFDPPDRLLNFTITGIRRAKAEEFILVIEDVTERARLTEEIRQAKDFMETIFETTVDMVVATDKRGFNTFVNRAFAVALGYERDDLSGRHVSVFYDTGMERTKDIMKLLTGDQELHDYRMEILTREGKEIPVSLSGSLLKDKGGEVTGTLGFLRDITGLVQAEEDIRKKNKELESFVYTISHDLRAPVVSIQGFSSILLSDFQDKIDETGKRYLTRIQANVRRMETLIDDLLEFSRIGRMADAFENVPSAKIIGDVLNVLDTQLKERGIKMDVQGKLPVINCEENRIYQAFENLIQNSIKYMGNTESPVIEVGCGQTNGFHEFYVKDNGIGIDPEYHQKIFQVFQRLKEVDAKGTGIGLSIVEKIAEIHGGSVRVESERGKGATFWFSVPG